MAQSMLHKISHAISGAAGGVANSPERINQIPEKSTVKIERMYMSLLALN
jgi:hypothetical protein